MNAWRNRVLLGSAEDLSAIPDGVVQCCVTSPPYYGLRDYQVSGQIGLEPTLKEYVSRLVHVFREVRRVLRSDGVAWVNLGDSYASGKSDSFGCKAKDLIGVPWTVAFALREDGWFLRSDVVWSKPNPMSSSAMDRPTSAHEYVFLLAKSSRYFYDIHAVAERSVSDHLSGNGFKRDARLTHQNADGSARGSDAKWTNVGGERRSRTVWLIATQPRPKAHFATFPDELARRCIAAGSSESGACAECGSPLTRIVEQERIASPKHAAGSVVGRRDASGQNNFDGAEMPRFNLATRTIGWKRSCDHADASITPCVVIDPFMGSGTVAVVAVSSGRDYTGCELSPEYHRLISARLGLFAQTETGAA